MLKNPWKILSRSLKSENKWFSVCEDQVIQPDGQPGTYNVVSAGRLATGILPMWLDGTITLVGQYRYPLKEYSWEIPEGGGAFDVDPEVTARRELKEETGIEAGRCTYLGRIHTSNCFMDEVCHIFLAEDLTQGEATPDPQEVPQTRRLPLKDAVEMASNGKITDAISVVGIFRLMHHLNESRDSGAEKRG